MYERTYHDRVLKTDSKKPTKKKFSWKRFLIGIAILVAISGIVFLIRVPRFQVSIVSVEGIGVTDPTLVKEYVMQKISGSYLSFLPRSSIILISPEQMSMQIDDHFPRFKSVTVRRTSMHEISVKVVEYTPIYIWCDEVSACSFMDEVGTVFADAPEFSGNVYLKLMGGQRAPYPFSPIDSKTLALVSVLSERLKKIDIEPLSFVIQSEKKMTIVFLHHTWKTELLWDPTSDTEHTLDTLYTGLNTEPLLSQYLDPKRELQYLDVRFGNKVIYKFK